MGRNAQLRRFRRDVDKKLHHSGPTGEPHPFGSREYRRSKEGKRAILEYVKQIRELSLAAASETQE
jgi:hypothetical protein